MESMVNDLSHALTRYSLADTQGRLHCLRATPRRRCASSSVRMRSPVTAIFRSSEIASLTAIAHAHLILSKPRAALAATRRATTMHRSHDPGGARRHVAGADVVAT
jgi:hypothetical protein